MKTEDQIRRIINRFEIAVSNFGRSCIDMQANEKAFQAWYASSLIQEFGISYVYREIHLWKKELFDLAPANKLTDNLKKGNELFPDISVSWYPDIDARHSSTRESKLKEAGALLKEFVIISEFKVTGSTLNPTSQKDVLKDIAKLSVFSEAHKTFGMKNGSILPLKCYMVVLDNAKNIEGDFRKSYSKDKIEKMLEQVIEDWKDVVPKPCIVLISPGNHSARVSLLKEFNQWIDLQ